MPAARSTMPSPVAGHLSNLCARLSRLVVGEHCVVLTALTVWSAKQQLGRQESCRLRQEHNVSSRSHKNSPRKFVFVCFVGKTK